MNIEVKQSPEAVWKATLGELELQMTRQTFYQWLKGSRFIGVHEDTFSIGVDNPHGRDWLNLRLKPTIEGTLSAIAGRPCTVEIGMLDEFEARQAMSENGRDGGRENGNGRTAIPEPPEEPPQERPWAVQEDGYGGNLTPEQRAEMLAGIKEREERNEAGVNGSGKGNGRKDSNGDGRIRYRKIRKPTDPLNGFVATTHYAIRFWRPYLGADLFDLLLIISSYAYEFEKLDKEGPSLKTLVNKLGRGDLSKMVGRPPTTTRGGKKYPGCYGLLNELRDHNLCHHNSEGKGRGQKQYFDYLTKMENLPMLTPKQVATLSQEDQDEHYEWLLLHTTEETGGDLEAWLADERETRIPALSLEEYA